MTTSVLNLKPVLPPLDRPLGSAKSSKQRPLSGLQTLSARNPPQCHPSAQSHRFPLLLPPPCQIPLPTPSDRVCAALLALNNRELPQIRKLDRNRHLLRNRRGCLEVYSGKWISNRGKVPETDHCQFYYSVATAATATSLLSHGNQAVTPNEASTDSGSSQSRVTGPRAALEALRNRLRASGRSTGSARDGRETEDSGNAAANRGVEDVLREYMRHAMASSRNASRLSDADGSDRPTPLSTLLPTSDPASFEAFLNNMQTSLIEALSAFVEESDAEVNRGDQASITADEVTSPAPIATERTGADTEAAPSARPAVAAGEAAQPRRLNFFRLFQFPPRRNAPENPSDPAVDLIPVVIVGVRSMNGDINSLTAQNVAAAPFPFNPTDDIQGPAPAQDGESAPATGERIGAANQPRSDASQRAQSPDAPRASGSWGNRAMRSINRLRRPRSAATNTEGTEADEAFTRNYVLWVVGGNYPAGHPILTIPHLFTGELSHEDLWHVSPLRLAKIH